MSVWSSVPDRFARDPYRDGAPTELTPAYPFEWIGLVHLTRGSYELTPRRGHGSTVGVALLPVEDVSIAELEVAQAEAVLLFADDGCPPRPDGAARPDGRLARCTVGIAAPTVAIEIEEPGCYAVVAEYRPVELLATSRASRKTPTPRLMRRYRLADRRDDELTAVGIRAPGELDVAKFSTWFHALRAARARDLLQVDGVLCIAGGTRRFMFQGAPLPFGRLPDRLLGAERAASALILIGRNLDQAALGAGLRACRR